MTNEISPTVNDAKQASENDGNAAQAHTPEPEKISGQEFLDDYRERRDKQLEEERKAALRERVKREEEEKIIDKECAIIRKYELDRLDALMLKYLIEFPSATLKELAKLTGLHLSTCGRRISRDTFQDALAEQQGTTIKMIEKAQRVSALRMIRLANADNDQTALEAGKLLLKPMLGENLNVNMNQRMIFSTQIGEGGRINTETTMKELEDEHRKKLAEAERGEDATNGERPTSDLGNEENGESDKSGVDKS